MKIGITYNLKEELSPAVVLDNEYGEEFDTIHTIDAICNVFERNAYEAARLGSGIEIIEKIRREKVDFVFNLAEGCTGRNRESHIPSVLEMLNIPYSGSDPLTLGLALDKIIAKKICLQADIPAPGYKAVRKIEDLLDIESELCYPVITKPSWEGSSKGVYNSSKVLNKRDLERSVITLLGKYPDQPVLVEEYIEGREITVGVIGNTPPRILGVMEIVNKIAPGKDFFYSLEVKRNWEESVDYICPADINQPLDRDIRYYAIKAFKEFACRDIARMDFRVSQHNKIFLLEVNPLPGLSPEYSDLVIMSQKSGMEYEDLILAILNHALSRYTLVKKVSNYETI